ncbi:hypothetical protein Tco_0675177 [Tanacetum coccineum]
MDEEFTATAYPNIQENLKLTVDDPVIPEEPAISIRTLSSLQHLAKDFSFGDQFFNDKPPEANNEKATADTKAESMVSVTIHQDTYVIPPMTSPVIDLVSVPDSPTVHQTLPTTTAATATTTILTTIPLPPQPQQVSSDSILLNRLGELEQHIADLVDANQALEERLDKHGSRLYRERFRDLPEADMKEILHNQMWESKSYQTHEDHMTLYEALDRDNKDQLMSDLAEVRKKKKKRQGSPKTPSSSPPHPPPPPPPPAGIDAPSSSKTAASAEYTAWTMTDTRIKPSISPIPKELHMGDDTTADEQAYSSSDRLATPKPAWSIPSSDLTVPTNNWASTLKSTYTPPPENSLLAQIGDMETFMDGYCKKQGISELTQKDLEGPAYEIVKVFHPDVGRKIGRPALSISKMKAAYYPDVCLEQMVPDHMWIEEECKYDVAAMYGISHWWFQKQRFYIDRHTSEGDRMAVRTHMRILSVVRIEVFPMYGYNYMKKIVLRRADLKEYVIAERDFKYLYPSDFEDLYLLNLRGHLNHLSPEDKKILTTAVNLWTKNLVIRQRNLFRISMHILRGSEWL